MSQAVAVFRTKEIEGDIVVSEHKRGIKLVATFTKLPKGKHGFHIHRAGDLRGEGCQGLCEHYDLGHHEHGGPPDSNEDSRGHGLPLQRHTGDLGNIELTGDSCEYEYFLPNVHVRDLWGRSIIVHEDEDDLGKGPFEDSKITGHAGKRMGCAIFGRTACKTAGTDGKTAITDGKTANKKTKSKTRKHRRSTP